ncbi:hypothetical protein BST92_14140 [Nonlabens arenilitoris]|uniref:Uncharacterized protein n=1 Tax=Nonlabens arenilitoris TaxID=1217969 RepID=A0A2S7UEH1_9FLAO|nr:bacteriocin fulvocin C-related protein [Nonlabens arenilitoris]PQJ32991.1 hypothetical protein BST92_14140 [Nonlabens arenilitoris]
MKKISLILSMVLFTMLITSCEQENIAQDNNDFQKSGTFDAETTYWSILGNTESGMDQFDALTNEQKQAVWVFKYDRFIADNTLTMDQLAVVNVVKDYVSTVDFSAEPNESNLDAIESQLAAEFDENTTYFLFLSLENEASDVAQKSTEDERPRRRNRFFGSSYSWGACGPNSNGDGGCSEGQYRSYRAFWITTVRDQPVSNEDGTQVTRACEC